MKRSKAEQKQEAQWQKTPLANLVRNTASGNYYARVRLKGKLIWKSLKTDALAVAKLRLGDFLKEAGHRAEVVESAARGKVTFADSSLGQQNDKGFFKSQVQTHVTLTLELICEIEGDVTLENALNVLLDPKDLEEALNTSLGYCREARHQRR